jgi:hypothetical protein
MAGKIIADTIETGAGADISTSYVVNGSAKAWVNFNGTGTIAARDSLNLSSLTDNAGGDYTVTFSSALGNTDYAPTGIPQIGITSSDAALTSIMIRTGTNAAGSATTMTTTANRILCKYVSTSNLNETDSAVVTYKADGDLA